MTYIHLGDNLLFFFLQIKYMYKKSKKLDMSSVSYLTDSEMNDKTVSVEQIKKNFKCDDLTSYKFYITMNPHLSKEDVEFAKNVISMLSKKEEEQYLRAFQQMEELKSPDSIYEHSYR